MVDLQNGVHKEEGTEMVPKGEIRNYQGYVKAVLKDKFENGRLPVVTNNPNKLEEQAKKCLPEKIFNFISSGAGERSTMDANRLAFRQWKIVPRMLRASTKHDLRTMLFGQELNTPIFLAPFGLHAMFHKDREVGTAAAAKAMGIPYSLSSASTSSMEEVAESYGPGGHLFYQLYWPQRNELTLSLLDHAKKAGYSVLFVTLDTWHLGWRPHDLDAGTNPFTAGYGTQVMMANTCFRQLFAEKYPGKVIEDEPVLRAELFGQEVINGTSHTWDELKFLRDNWDGPIVLKGIQSGADARLAVQHGMDGVYVSNHGGRQLDGAIGSLDALADVVDEVGGETTVLFDSGTRTGADVIKALSIGADAVGIGRPAVYGLSINGKEGVKTVLSGILADIDSTASLAGLTSIRDCNRSLIKRTNYPGDRHANY